MKKKCIIDGCENNANYNINHTISYIEFIYAIFIARAHII